MAAPVAGRVRGGEVKAIAPEAGVRREERQHGVAMGGERRAQRVGQRPLGDPEPELIAVSADQPPSFRDLGDHLDGGHRE